MRELGLAATLFLLLSAPTAAADTIIGRWCDTAWPNGNEITILRTDDGRLRVSSNFGDGSSVVHPLRLQDGTYRAVGEDFGAHYRIGANGELRLFDNDGFIRSARPGRCRR